MRGTWLLLLSFTLAASACLTTRNNKAISEYRSSINEFDRPLGAKGNYRILPGRLQVQDGVARMQFDRLLIGDGRYLNVESSPRGLRFFESRQRLTGKENIFLIQQNACCMDEKAFRAILFLKPGEKADLADILKDHFAFTAAPSYPAGLLVMDFTNIYSFSAMHGFWQKEAELAYFVQAPGSDYNDVLGDIEWVRRSRFQLALLYGWYGIAVPLDIVTSPFQLAAVLLVGPGAK